MNCNLGWLIDAVLRNRKLEIDGFVKSCSDSVAIKKSQTLLARNQRI